MARATGWKHLPQQHAGRTRPLPPYRALLVVDAKDFSGQKSTHQQELNDRIPNVLAAAFDRAGLQARWTDRRFPAQEGDSYILGTDPEAVPFLVDPLLDELQAVLAEQERERLAHAPRLRLRASVHVGPLPDNGQPGDGVGTPMTDVHRLLDADVVKRQLEDSSAEVTLLAAIISRRVYEDAIQAGYTSLHPDRLQRVHATGKNLSEPAWLYTPVLSGGLLSRTGALATPDHHHLTPDAAPLRPASKFSVGHNTGQVNQADTITGVSFNAPPADHGRPEEDTS